MAIKGSLKAASLPDVLQLLAMGKKTGCLSVTHRSNFGYIYFDKGRIAYASIVNRRDRIDEWSLIEKKIPSFDVVFDLDRDRLTGSDAEMTPEQEQLVPLIDGRRDV